jgi:anti-sigma factor RsiW
MQEEDYEKVMETAWRRPLTSEEEAALQRFLATHPQAKRSWDEEAALNRLLQRWPAPPVSSNFTARVMQAVQNAPARRNWMEWFAPGAWFPEGLGWRVAMPAMMLCVGLFSFHETQALRRVAPTPQLAAVNSSPSVKTKLPPVEWLKDFDTIKNISQVKVADDDLLAALQ